MVRVAKKKNARKTKSYEDVNSDSENDHYNDRFDPNNPFEDDEIEKFHNDKDKVLLSGINRPKKSEFLESSDEEEVLAFDDEDSDDYDASKANVLDGDDSEEEEDERSSRKGGQDADDLALKSSWGRRKSSYYSGNRLRTDEDAQLEEEEAALLQAKMMKELDQQDFGLDAFVDRSAAKRKVLKTNDELAAEKLAQTHLGRHDDDDESVEKVIKNLSKMSKKEKLDFLRQESPELFELVNDFKQKIEELETTLLPIYRHIKQGNGFPPSMASEYIVNKTKLYLMYCAHLSFYFILKSKRLTIENHPIVKNILQYRNIEQIDDKLKTEVIAIRKSIEAGRPLCFIKPDQMKAKKKSVRFRDLTQEQQQKQRRRGENLKFDDVDATKASKIADMEDEDEEEKEESADSSSTSNTKRAINKAIEKNKGLTPKRPKEYRNPRVRNRLKARKALIKHKSIVPKVRSQDRRYSGEATGIRTAVVRAVKFK